MAKINAVPFDRKEYWETRFEKEKHFEWLMTWQDAQAQLEPYLDKNEPILHLGCGNSELAFKIADSGYRKIVNVDYAENVIEQMKSVTQNKQSDKYSEVSWYVGDCLNNLASYLPHKEYGVLIDKSLIDAIACGDDDEQSKVKAVAQEFLSVAKPNALWFSITFSGEREFYCDNQEKSFWRTLEKVPVQVRQANDKPGAPPIYYYIYINRKEVSPL